MFNLPQPLLSGNPPTAMFPYYAQQLAPPPPVAPSPQELALQQAATRPPPTALPSRSGDGYTYLNGDLHTGHPFILASAGGPPPAHNTAAVPGPASGSGQYFDLGGAYGGAAVSMAPTTTPAPYPQYNMSTVPVSSESVAAPVGGATAQTPVSAQPANSVIDSSSRLWKDLKMQLEYYFSPQNLEKDEHLKQNMDADGYVPISMIAAFNKVVNLTKDVQLVTSVLRDSTKVQVDAAGERVRPLLNTGTLMLREIPESTPVSEVERLFDNPKCPRLVNCYFGLQDHWYATFESQTDAMKAYSYLKENNVLFRNRPVLVRIKSTVPIASYSRGRQPDQFPPSTQARTPNYNQSAPPVSTLPQQSAPSVYQEPPPPAPARVYTPQPVVQQPPMAQLPPPPPSAALGAPGPLSLGPAVQLVPAPPNYAVMPPNYMPIALFADPLSGMGPMIVQRPQTVQTVYDYPPQQRTISFQDVRYRQQRTALVMPATPHHGFSNAGAGLPTGMYTQSALTRLPRRDSAEMRTPRFNPPRPSSASFRAESLMAPPVANSRVPAVPLHTETAITPATVDVASATDVPSTADAASVAMPADASVMSASHVNTSMSSIHTTEPSNVMEPVMRKSQQLSNWRHNDTASRSGGSRPNRRGGRYHDEGIGKSWNAREQPVEQKFNFEATSFPPLTSTHATSTDDVLRYTSSVADESDVRQSVCASIDTTQTVSSDGLTVSIDAVPTSCTRLLNDGSGNDNGIPVTISTTSDLEALEASKRSNAHGSARLSYAEIAQRGGKDGVQVAMSLPTAPDADVTQVAEVPNEVNAGPAVSPLPRQSYHQSDPVHHTHHGTGQHYPHDMDRHPSARRGRGSGQSTRPYRMFFPSDSAQGRGGRYRGHAAHDGYAPRTITDDQPQAQQS